MDKDQFEQVLNIKRELNHINFGNGGIIQTQGDISSMHYHNAFKGRNGEVVSVCEECKDALELPFCNNCSSKEKCDKTEYRLRNMAHGTHTIDYLFALDKENRLEKMEDCASILCDENWNDLPVLFLLENPSTNYYDLYASDNKMRKRPANGWFWIGSDYSKKDYTYPHYLAQGWYGEMICALIKMFKLGNAYATDIVKCGMNGEDGNGYLSTWCYNPECIRKCVGNYLVKEIKTLTKYNKTIVVFAFSQRVASLINGAFSSIPDLKDINPIICLMPHPSNRLANDYRKYVLYGKAKKALYLAGIDTTKADLDFLENDNHFGVLSSIDYNAVIEHIKKGYPQLAVKKVSQYRGEWQGLRYKVKCTKNAFTNIDEVVEICCQVMIDNKKVDFGYRIGETGFWIWNTNNKEIMLASDLDQYSQEIYNIYNSFVEAIEKQ